MPWWTSRKTPKNIEVYLDGGGRWRWRAIARNGRVVDASEQGYSSKYYARDKAQHYSDTNGNPPIIFTTKDAK